MFKKVFYVLTVCLIILIFSQATTFAAAYYTVFMTEPKESHDLFYSDDNIAIHFPIPGKEISVIPFVLVNKTFEPINVDWNKIMFVAPNGDSLGVFHYGVLYKDAHGNMPMNPTLVPPKAKLSDSLGLKASIQYTAGMYGGWTVNPIFPTWYKDALPYKDNTFSIFMPLEINGKIKNYSFTFAIENVTKEAEELGYMGIRSFDKNNAVIYGLNAKPEKGIYVYEVFKNTPAEKAGLLKGDTITQINNIEITGSSDFIKIINHSKPNDKLQVTVERNREPKTLFVILGSRKE